MTHRIDRRQALAALGSVSLGSFLAACGSEDQPAPRAVTTTEGARATVTPKAGRSSAAAAALLDDARTCAVTAELTEGPYYFDVDSIRSDIREDREGALLRLAVRVRDAGSCQPIENAIVDVWHCDATGLYSGFESASMGGPGGRRDEETYLRGAQATNADGIVEFKTVYPGWYRGRTVHIHAKVHLDRQTVLTTQFFFEEAMTERVYAAEPYAGDEGRDVFNDSDGIFDESLMLTTARRGDDVLGAITLDVRRA
jgi:protocatechuate 3,4-dioxygenase beta subunit